MASRGSLDVLQPIQLNQLHDAPRPPLKKRKLSASSEWAADNIVIRVRCEPTQHPYLECTDIPTFWSKAHAASLYDEPYVLEPIAVISRHQFPFDWLDVPSALSQIQSGSLFIAQIPSLESDAQPELNVLIVRLASDGGLYVIERVKRGIYSLSKLARGVEEGDVRVVVKASSHRANALPPCTPRKQVEVSADGSDWWRMAQVDDPAPDLSIQVPTKLPKVDFVFGVNTEPVDSDEQMKSMSPVDPMDGSSSYDVRMLSVPPESQLPADTAAAGGDGAGEENVCETTQSPQELLDGLRAQYLQSLYVSKVCCSIYPIKIPILIYPDICCILDRKSVV